MHRATHRNATGVFFHAAAAAACALALLALPGLSVAQQKFNEWGWPVPYERISDKSVKWLQDKGWWPLQVAYQGPWSGQNTVNIVMDKQGLLKARGLETKYQSFASGPAINEVIISSRFQAASGGNFPFSSLLDKKIPVTALAIESPNLLHAMVVPKDSPLKSIKDLKGGSEPAAIGLVTGSSGEFYVQMAAAVNGIQPGKDIILKNMSPGEQLGLPKGLAAVAPWDPTVAMITDERKTGRIIDTIYPYNMYEGTFYVRSELVQNVPDVVQALTDAFAEATLWTRLYPEKAAALMAADPTLKNYPKTVLLDQIKKYNNLYKPTYIYPHAEFWGKANEPIYKWLYENKRLVRPLAAKDFSAAVNTQFMDKTFAKLGWAVPKQPPFIPANWNGSPDKLPYPEYLTAQNMKAPQPFPDKGDLVKPWAYNGTTHEP